MPAGTQEKPAYAVEAEFGPLFNPEAPDPGLFYVKALPLGM